VGFCAIFGHFPRPNTPLRGSPALGVLSTPAHPQVTHTVSPPVDFVDLKVLASLLSFSDFDAKYLPPYNVS
jgi:hypothetical protein